MVITIANTVCGNNNRLTKSVLSVYLFLLILTSAMSFMAVKVAPTTSLHRIMSTAALDGRQRFLGL